MIFENTYILKVNYKVVFSTLAHLASKYDDYVDRMKTILLDNNIIMDVRDGGYTFKIKEGKECNNIYGTITRGLSYNEEAAKKWVSEVSNAIFIDYEPSLTRSDGRLILSFNMKYGKHFPFEDIKEDVSNIHYTFKQALLDELPDDLTIMKGWYDDLKITRFNDDVIFKFGFTVRKKHNVRPT